MQDLSIRPVVHSDFDAVYNFVCGLEEEQYDRAAFRACFEGCMAQANNYYLIALAGDVPVGYISAHGQLLMHHCGMVYEIQEFYVLPDLRGQGVGKQLLQVMLQLLGEKNHELIEVCFNMARTDAHRVYQSAGFVATSYKFKFEGAI